MFQCSIRSICQLLPHGGKVHGIINDIMIIRKLQRGKELNFQPRLHSNIKINNLRKEKSTHLFRINWLSIHTICVLPAIIQVKKTNNIKHFIIIKNTKEQKTGIKKTTYFWSLSRINSRVLLSGNGNGIPDRAFKGVPNSGDKKARWEAQYPRHLIKKS